MIRLGAPKPSAKAAALFAALVLVAGSFQIARPGYSVDEEFTEFAVRGIHEHGLPLLPSGLLYDRGLAYSYASAVINGRIVSLVSAALAVLLTFFLVRRIADDPAGVIASLLVMVSVPFWATATSARFYGPFLGAYLLALYFLTHRHWWLGLFAAAALARLTHELAFTLLAVPAVCLVFAREERRRWLMASATVAAGLVAGQAVLFALHALEPTSGETMVRRFFLWQVLNLFERPGDRQFGIPLVVALVAMVLAPRRAFLWAVSGVSIAVAIAVFSIARATNSAPLSIELIRSVLADGSRYPLDMFWHIARTTPFTLTLALSGLVARLAGAGGDWRPSERAVHVLWIGWVLWFGVIDSGITTNYLLLPISFMLIAIAVDVSAFALRASADRMRWSAIMLAVAAVLVFDQWRGTSLDAARPTIHVPEMAEIRESLQPNDRVVCTDELGCLMLVGRIDRWLALDDFVRERFLVRRGNDTAIGVYTGAPAIFRPGALFSPNPDGTLPDRVIVVDVFKDYPIGNSRTWLPKAIEEDGLVVQPLLETPQARVLQVSPPERVARLR